MFLCLRSPIEDSLELEKLPQSRVIAPKNVF